MKVVAKKIIENSHMIDQLKNEVNIMSTLSHPRIIHLHTIFEDQKNIYFVLELAEEVGDFNQGPPLLTAAGGGQVRRKDRSRGSRLSLVRLRRVQGGGLFAQTEPSYHP